LQVLLSILKTLTHQLNYYYMKQKSYSYGLSQYALLGETIGENLSNTCSKFPDREALISVHQDYRATYSMLWRQVTTVAKALLAINVKKEDRVASGQPTGTSGYLYNMQRHA
jgi:hypothetical protein